MCWMKMFVFGLCKVLVKGVSVCGLKFLFDENILTMRSICLCFFKSLVFCLVLLNVSGGKVWSFVGRVVMMGVKVLDLVEFMVESRRMVSSIFTVFVSISG